LPGIYYISLYRVPTDVMVVRKVSYLYRKIYIKLYISIIINRVHAHENILTEIRNRTITSSRGVNSIQLNSENFIGFRPQKSLFESVQHE